MPDNVSLTPLITAHNNGDPAAFEQIYYSSLPGIRAVCQRYLADGPDAEDAIQETFVKIYKKLPTLKDPATFPAWSRTIAKNTCLNMIRSRSLLRGREEIRPTTGDDETAGIEDISAAEYRKEFNPEAALDSRVKAEIMREIFKDIGDVQRSCILLWAEGET